jgi:hypothetical protein
LREQPIKESGFIVESDPGIDRNERGAGVVSLEFDEVFASDEDGADAVRLDRAPDVSERTGTVFLVVRENEGYDAPVPPKRAEDRPGIAGSDDIKRGLGRRRLRHTDDIHSEEGSRKRVLSQNFFKVKEDGFGEVLRTREYNGGGSCECVQRLAKRTARQAMSPQPLRDIVEDDVHGAVKAPVLEAVVQDDARGRRFGSVEEQAGGFVAVTADGDGESEAPEEGGLIAIPERVAGGDDLGACEAPPISARDDSGTNRAAGKRRNQPGDEDAFSRAAEGQVPDADNGNRKGSLTGDRGKPAPVQKEPVEFLKRRKRTGQQVREK